MLCQLMILIHAAGSLVGAGPLVRGVAADTDGYHARRFSAFMVSIILNLYPSNQIENNRRFRIYHRNG
jgi:hypothetical protein